MKQHLHNRIGNIIGERKHELYSRLKSGADVEREIDAFMEELGAELTSAVPSKSVRDAASAQWSDAIEAPPDAAALEAMSHGDVEEIAERYGVDTSKHWSKSELIERIGHAYEWAGKPDPDGLRARALALLNPNREPPLPAAQRWHLEFYCETDSFDVVAQLVERIERGESSFDDVLIEADDRTLDGATIARLCKHVADSLENEHLIGYLFALFDHVAAAARSTIGAETEVMSIKKYLLSENATARDEATDRLKSDALAALAQERK